MIKPKICRPRSTGLWAGYAPDFYTHTFFVFLLELKREAESRFDIKSKVKEEPPTVKVEQKVEEERKQTETRPSGNSTDQN